jgi:hypothetical protein
MVSKLLDLEADKFFPRLRGEVADSSDAGTHEPSPVTETVQGRS